MDIVAVKIFLNWTSGCGKIAVKVCMQVDLGVLMCTLFSVCAFYYRRIFDCCSVFVKMLQTQIWTTALLFNFPIEEEE